MNSVPNLIVGFEDIITHIKNQEKRIQELENKNEELLDKCHQRFKENAKNISLGANVYHRIKKENDELTEELEGLKLTQLLTLKVSNDKEKEIKKLEEYIEDFQESDKHLNKCIDSIRDQYLEQKEENKKLKENAKNISLGANVYHRIKKENEDLSDQIEQLGELCKNIDENAYDTWKKITSYEESDEEC